MGESETPTGEQHHRPGLGLGPLVIKLSRHLHFSYGSKPAFEYHSCNSTPNDEEKTFHSLPSLRLDMSNCILFPGLIHHPIALRCSLFH